MSNSKYTSTFFYKSPVKVIRSWNVLFFSEQSWSINCEECLQWTGGIILLSSFIFSSKQSWQDLLKTCEIFWLPMFVGPLDLQLALPCFLQILFMYNKFVTAPLKQKVAICSRAIVKGLIETHCCVVFLEYFYDHSIVSVLLKIHPWPKPLLWQNISEETWLEI